MSDFATGAFSRKGPTGGSAYGIPDIIEVMLISTSFGRNSLRIGRTPKELLMSSIKTNFFTNDCRDGKLHFRS